MKPAAQYLRMSSDEQRYSIDNQIALIGDYAARRGYKIVRSYKDEGRSGVTATGRLQRSFYVVHDAPYAGVHNVRNGSKSDLGITPKSRSCSRRR